ncbi:MucR family transcriptional regulator [Acetobacter malorum]|nr:MucR family transcriptional regulator [Acetobacter malorum]
MTGFLELTAQIVAAYVSNNTIEADQLPQLVKTVHAALANAATPAVSPEESTSQPAVSPKKSVFPDYIICLEDGKKLKTLKRHLMTAYGLTPAQYREKWGLPPVYPMVAPAYAERRSALARENGLGKRLLASKPAMPDPAAIAEPEVPAITRLPERKRGRRSKSATA